MFLLRCMHSSDIIKLAKKGALIMFCPNCGQQITDNSKFCLHCGKAISAIVPDIIQPVTDFQVQKNAVRQSEIKVLSDALDYFSKKKDLFEEYDRLRALVRKFSRGARGALLIWGCIISTAGYLILLMLLAQNSEQAIRPTYSFFQEMVIVSAFTIIPGFIMIIGGVLMKVNNRKKRKLLEKKFSNVAKEIQYYYLNYPLCPVGPEFANPDSLYKILSVLQSGRADTIKEALNLSLNKEDRAKAMEYLKQIEKNTSNPLYR